MRVIPPPVIFLVCLIAGTLLHQRWPLSLGIPWWPSIVAGITLLLAAALLGGSALREMHRHQTPVEPWKEAKRLVVSGPFRISRNPLYLALTTVLLAIAIMADSLWLLAATAILPLLLYQLVIRKEEAFLRSRFGEEYEGYVRRVRRWI